MKPHTKYAICGALAGAANGFFGAGGGLFLVPLLTAWTGMEQKKSFATSVAIILPLSVVSAGIYFFRGGLDFLFALPYMIGGIVGGIIAGRMFRDLNPLWLRRIFGLFILYGGIRAVFLL